MQSRRILAVAVLCGLIPALAGCEGGDGGDDATPDAATEAASRVEPAPIDPSLAAALPAGASIEAVEEGRALFAPCATCHGFDAAGTQLGPPLRDAEWIQGTGELPEIQAVIRDGVAEPEEYPVPMPVLGGGNFTPAQVEALAVYVYALSHARR